MSKDMTPHQHIHKLLFEFNELAEAKYMAGQREHGGHLWEVPSEQLIDFAIEEAIDQVIYLLTLKRKLKEERREAKKDT